MKKNTFWVISIDYIIFRFGIPILAIFGFSYLTFLGPLTDFKIGIWTWLDTPLEGGELGIIFTPTYPNAVDAAYVFTYVIFSLMLLLFLSSKIYELYNRKFITKESQLKINMILKTPFILTLLIATTQILVFLLDASSLSSAFINGTYGLSTILIFSILNPMLISYILYLIFYKKNSKEEIETINKFSLVIFFVAIFTLMTMITKILAYGIDFYTFLEVNYPEIVNGPYGPQLAELFEKPAGGIMNRENYYGVNNNNPIFITAAMYFFVVSLALFYLIEFYWFKYSEKKKNQILSLDSEHNSAIPVSFISLYIFVGIFFIVYHSIRSPELNPGISNDGLSYLVAGDYTGTSFGWTMFSLVVVVRSLLIIIIIGSKFKKDSNFLLFSKLSFLNINKHISINKLDINKKIPIYMKL